MKIETFSIFQLYFLFQVPSKWGVGLGLKQEKHRSQKIWNNTGKKRKYDSWGENLD
jgi:hypothetical protein